ncbi:ABC transporter ATP-binding protein [Eubacteriales bacterium OttesenSCG-928-K08]|nr:ABC transporter ATP-binding protein [Eubacteriales bacterium OttesenSCG-928-K08]
MSHTVSIREVIKKFGDFTAVDKISIEINQGEFFTLLGPSGCGKTTLLRAIAGFNKMDGGEIAFSGSVINNVPAHKRDIGMVFQNYAIFPHMTVKENIAYGLKAKKVPRPEIERRTEEALEMVQIAPLKDRKPSELSGGQQQRVALARAFVIEPRVLLMDEPLSNLDAKLRVQMRTTIKKLQRTLGITTIYVTHDQEEALAVSDRIAVMKDGHIMQVGSPEEVYRRPANRFVAGFIGTSNFIDCEAKTEGSETTLRISSDYGVKVKTKRPIDGPAVIAGRPEQLFFSDGEGIPGEITISTFLGDFVEYEILTESGQTLQLNEYTKDVGSVRPDGQKVHLRFDPKAISLIDPKTEEVISDFGG